MTPDSTTPSTPAFTCFRCGDGNTPLYCLNCAEDLLAKAKAPTPPSAAPVEQAEAKLCDTISNASVQIPGARMIQVTALRAHVHHAIETATARLKAKALIYKKVFDALVAMGLVKSDPGSSDSWAAEMIAAVDELRAEVERLKDEHYKHCQERNAATDELLLEASVLATGRLHDQAELATLKADNTELREGLESMLRLAECHKREGDWQHVAFWAEKCLTSAPKDDGKGGSA